MTVYMKELRNQIPAAPSSTAREYVFLTWNGESMTSGQISSAMKSVWNKAGLSGNVSATGIRKAAVSLVHSSRDEMAGNLADMMSHDIAAKTSQEWSKMIRTENPRVGKDKLETDKKEQPLTACDKEPPKQINTFTQEQLYEIRRNCHKERNHGCSEIENINKLRVRAL